MADTRRDKRAPVSLKVRFKSATVDEFIEQYARDISRGGIFIKSKAPMAVGTLLKFEFQLKDESRLIHGVGRVVWKREADDADAENMPGMGIKFIKMDPESRGLVESIVTQRGDEEGQFEAGKDPRKRPPKKGTEPFFPAAPKAEDLPPPEDSTQVRHASEFLASALMGGGADEAATAEAKAKAEQARKRTEEIQRQREADAAQRKAEAEERERGEKEARERARAESEAAAEKEQKAKAAEEQKARIVAEFASTTADAADDVDLDAMLDEAVAEAVAETGPPPAVAEVESRRALERAATVSGEDAARVEKAEKPPVVVATPPKELRESARVRPTPAREETKSSMPLVLGGVVVLLVVGFLVYRLGFSGDDTQPPEPVVEGSPVAEDPTVDDEPIQDEVVEDVVEPDPAVPTTPIRMTSTPPGATIFVGGREAGTTPGDIEMPIGELVTVAARLSGYAEATQDVAAEQGQAPLRFALDPLPYVIEVRTTPEGARVVADGRRATGGEVALAAAPTRTVRVVATMAGYERTVATLDVDAFRERNGRMVAEATIMLPERASPTVMMQQVATAMVTTMAPTMETTPTMEAEPTMDEPPPTMTEPPPDMDVAVPDNPF